jgi:hypothetical protein
MFRAGLARLLALFVGIVLVSSWTLAARPIAAPATPAASAGATAHRYDGPPNNVDATQAEVGTEHIEAPAPPCGTPLGAPRLAPEAGTALTEEGGTVTTALVKSEWPANRGFLGGPFNRTLKPGDLIDRYGTEEGTFASPAGTPFEQRGLPAYYEQAKTLSQYWVSSEFDVNTGAAAPAFGMPGLGIQYELPSSVADLIEQGLLERVP